MKSSSCMPGPSRRAGLSLIEIIVVLFCALLLAMVIVPYIQHQREDQRLIGCQNRMRGLAFAFVSELDDRGGRFPPLVDNDLPWTAGLLPNVEGTESSLVLFNNEPIEQQDPIVVPQLLCPVGLEYPAGKNCYVVNGGWGRFASSNENGVIEPETHAVSIDLNEDGEISEEEQLMIRATGLIWRPQPRETSWSRQEVETLDGLSQTLLLAETQNSSSWMSLQTFDLAFVVGLDRVNWGEAPDSFDFSVSDLGPFAINSSRGGYAGQWPSPSSLHAEGVNVLFADGAFRTISSEIDPLLYLRLMTPGGKAFGEARIEQTQPQRPDQPLK